MSAPAPAPAPAPTHLSPATAQNLRTLLLTLLNLSFAAGTLAGTYFTALSLSHPPFSAPLLLSFLSLLSLTLHLLALLLTIALLLFSSPTLFSRLDHHLKKSIWVLIYLFTFLVSLTVAIVMATWFAAREVERDVQPGLVFALVVLGGMDLEVCYVWVMVGWGGVEIYRGVRGRARGRWWVVRGVGRPGGSREEALGEIGGMFGEGGGGRE